MLFSFPQNLRLIQARVQEIEGKPTPKSPQDEAELATLQTKQQQILATGRPVLPAAAAPPGSASAASSAGVLPVAQPGSSTAQVRFLYV